MPTMTLSELQDEVAVPIKAAWRHEAPLVVRMAVPWPLIARVVLWVLEILADRAARGRPVIVTPGAVQGHNFDPAIVRAMRETGS